MLSLSVIIMKNECTWKYDAGDVLLFFISETNKPKVSEKAAPNTGMLV